MGCIQQIITANMKLKTILVMILAATLFSFRPAAPAFTYTPSAPLSYTSVNNITISGDSITGGSSICINLVSCSNVHITHCKFINSTNHAIMMNNCTNVTIDGNFFNHVRDGVYAVACKGGIKTIGNQFINMQGPYPQASAVQYSHCSGPFNKIINNRIDEVPGQSAPEDEINLYQDTGTYNSPLIVSGNFIRGGGPSTSGAGITAGDGGGGYQHIEHNICINTGAGGIQYAGGHNITIINNLIYSKVFSWSGFGLACSNLTSTPVYGMVVAYNDIFWLAGKIGGGHRDTVYKYNATYANPVPLGWYTNRINAPIDSTLLPLTLYSEN